MGIRFRCPNGHKIHVKSFLAGKRGICPKCGVKVSIPQQSDAEFAARSQVREPATSDSSKPSRPQAATAVQSADVSGQSSGTAAAHPSGREQPSEASADAIAAAPQAKWFVRPPSGGQYGPASGTLLREWIAAGRVTADSYVWREGWPEWQRAQAVFGTSTSAGAAPVPALAAPPVVAQAVPKSTLELHRRRQSNRMTLTIVGLLTLACAVLFAILVYVVHYMN
jgi:hypothetical protein